MTALDDLGVLGLSAQLRRLTDKFNNKLDRIYRNAGVDFQTAWFPIIFMLVDKDAMSVTELARETRQTHSAVSQLVKKLIAKGLIQRIRDDQDRRRSDLMLTDQGIDLVLAAKPVWDEIVDELNRVAGDSSRELIQSLAEFEADLDVYIEGEAGS